MSDDRDEQSITITESKEKQDFRAIPELRKASTRLSRRPSNTTTQWKAALRANSIPRRQKLKEQLGVDLQETDASHREHGGSHSDHGGSHSDHGGSRSDHGGSLTEHNGDYNGSRSDHQENGRVPMKQAALDPEQSKYENYVETNCSCFPKRKKPNVQSDLPLGNDEEKQALEYLMVVHNALVQQFNVYGIVLTLLAAVTSVAVLQPPGSFDNQGHMQPQSLVACFLLFSSLSFLLACTGLMAVIIGSASLFRPWFFPKAPSESQEIKNISFDTKAVDHAKAGDGVVYIDDISTLREIVLDNVLRVRRLRMYLALSLLLCMVAFVCGAFAILGSEKRNLYMAIGTIIGGGGIVLATETGMTLAGPTHPPKWLQDLCDLYSSKRTPGTSMKLRSIAR